MNAQEVFDKRMAERTAQVKVRKGFIVDGHSAGQVFYTTPHRARIFLDQNAVELVGGKVPGPTVTPIAGPTQLKASSSEAPTGRSSDSAASSQPGADASSSASAAGRRSTLTNATLFAESASGTAAASSRSTTRTSSRRSRT